MPPWPPQAKIREPPRPRFFLEGAAWRARRHSAGGSGFGEKTMSAYDDTFHVLQDSRWLRFKRDLRLLLWLGTFLYRFMTVGARMRRKYIRHKRLGQSLYID